ncbi:unnamed protein product [Bursaphelenchus okinawaensis]|uniref:Uncharacterized protein n=1 Tax=Bursaphelenchus okinawaensis TaxID=465554 RepID=A0A811JZW9_9BILA|nr:unnamed protein product [Bursaphelenchus okinawaensis]CAG9088603.1 unnamed protein product [Bursaphelenchus okinawaensis]
MKMNMFSPSTAAKYYFFDKKRDTADAEFIPMEPRMFAILLKKEQILFLFDVDKTIGPMYRWDFTDSEFVVSACWTKNTLFTLTRLGVVSRWKLLANGRKLREKHIDLKKEGCRQLITIDYDKFLIVSEQDASAIKWNS